MKNNVVMIVLVALTLCASALLFANKGNTEKTSGFVKEQIDSLVVVKHSRVMKAYHHKKLLRTYPVGVGSQPIGHKQQQGDNRTPEGMYRITMRNAESSYYKNLHINYPNASDRERCRKRGVDPGGDIKIHGYADSHGNTTNRTLYYGYTWGCVGVCNEHMDELFRWVRLGAVINILP